MSSKHHADVDGHDIDLHGDDGLVHVHVHPASTYIKIFFALVFLTLVTVGLSRIHLGEWNFFIAVVVATIKASLVAMFFMHLKDDNRFNVLIFVGSLVFMGVFFVYTMNDTEYRGQWDEAYGTKVSPSTGEVAPGQGLYQEIRLEGGHGEAHGGTERGHSAPAEMDDLERQGGRGPETGGQPVKTGENEETPKSGAGH